MFAQSPPSFIVKTEAEKAASNHGYRITADVGDGWLGYRSTTAKGQIWIASVSEHGPWLLATDHNGVVAEIGLEPGDFAGPGVARYAFSGLRELYDVLQRVYQLAASLPDAPLEQYRKRTNGLPASTEAERLVLQRIGQDVFRAGLMDYWRGCCPLTGIADPALLRASHIKSWAKCESDAERLDVHNGILLSALWDAAFDRGLATFLDDGTPEFSGRLSQEARSCLLWTAPVALSAAHIEKLRWHREFVFSRD